MLYYFGREVLLPSIEGNRTSLRKPRNLLWEVQILSAESQGTTPAVFSFFPSEVEELRPSPSAFSLRKWRNFSRRLQLLPFGSAGTSPVASSFFASEVEEVGGLAAGSQMLKRKEKCLSLRILIDEGAFRRPAFYKD